MTLCFTTFLKKEVCQKWRILHPPATDAIQARPANLPPSTLSLSPPSSFPPRRECLTRMWNSHNPSLPSSPPWANPARGKFRIPANQNRGGGGSKKSDFRYHCKKEGKGTEVSPIWKKEGGGGDPTIILGTVKKKRASVLSSIFCSVRRSLLFRKYLLHKCLPLFKLCTSIIHDFFPSAGRPVCIFGILG